MLATALSVPRVRTDPLLAKRHPTIVVAFAMRSAAKARRLQTERTTRSSIKEEGPEGGEDEEEKEHKVESIDFKSRSCVDGISFSNDGTARV